MFQSNESRSKGINADLPARSYSNNPYLQHLMDRLNAETNKATLFAQIDSLHAGGDLRLRQLNNQLSLLQGATSCKTSLEYSLKISDLKDSLAAINMCRNIHQIQALEAQQRQSNRRLEQAQIACFCLGLLLLFMIGYKLFSSVFNRHNTQPDTPLMPVKNDDAAVKNEDENDDIPSQKSTLDEEHLQASEQFITLTNREKTRLKLIDILYVQADSGGVNYHTAHGVYFNWQSLKSCLLLLPESSFVQISKTVVVARPAIIGKTKSMVRMINNAELNIGRAFQDKISDE